MSPLSDATLLPLRVLEADHPGVAAHLAPEASKWMVPNEDAHSVFSERLGSLSRSKSKQGHGHPITTSPPNSQAVVAIMRDVAYPQATGGRVDNEAVAVTTMKNEDGVLLDYYQQYQGSGSTDDGWPNKTSWISFADMSVKAAHQVPGSWQR